jgi:hypothetical protein
MATRQSTVRLPERSWQQVAELAGVFGDNTKVFLVAIDRLYQSEMKGVHRMDLRELASNIYDGQAATVADYGNDASLYAHELMELAEENGWLPVLSGQEREDLETILVEYALGDIQ